MEERIVIIILLLVILLDMWIHHLNRKTIRILNHLIDLDQERIMDYQRRLRERDD